MPTLKLSFKKADGGILFHGFLAANDKVTERMQTGHANVCPNYGPALRAGNTIEETIEVDEIPEFDDVSISAWVEEMFGLEADDDEEEPSEEGDEEK
jgi:hypothetical protein